MQGVRSEQNSLARAPPHTPHGQWRRQLWGTGARFPLDFHNFILVHLNLTANYPSMCGLPAEWLTQMSTIHSSNDQYCISHKTISHRSPAAHGPEIRRECSMPLLATNPGDASAHGAFSDPFGGR